MKAIPYISFNGNCEEAVNFYQSVLGGKISSIKYNELPKEEGMPVSETWQDKIMHAALTFDDGNVIYFGDSWETDPVRIGSNSTIHLVVENEKDVYEFVEKLSVDGEITMPADKTFWNSVYGSLVDKYGISWGIEFEIVQM
ncbi:MAG: VOC family protein [Bacillota bacterium]|nr:VOC family protein [Bacillota bacterium]